MSFPRMRGGDPRMKGYFDAIAEFSPHARG